jgi:hypothetical protein
LLHAHILPDLPLSKRGGEKVAVEKIKHKKDLIAREKRLVEPLPRFGNFSK